ncbi:flagellar hook-length control protein FliK [Burkholderia ubonensis]|uniref:flagellar hook-length control protein FliK n=1 Tax=Burkholderia ubonensis TaxID=101571 RepID=UPI000A986194|nr:flagellar hook-length control protein FliK [Burkholderia ubonensis]
MAINSGDAPTRLFPPSAQGDNIDDVKANAPNDMGVTEAMPFDSNAVEAGPAHQQEQMTESSAVSSVPPAADQNTPIDQAVQSIPATQSALDGVDKGDANSKTSEQQTEQADAVTLPKIECRFIGLDGSPINGLSYRLQSGSLIVDGVTDSDGLAAPVNIYTPGADCSISVKTDAGAYKQVARFTVPGVDSTITMMSPSMLLKTSTQLHGGAEDDVHKEPPSQTQVDDGGAEAHPAYADDAGGGTPRKTPVSTASAASGGAATSPPPVGVSTSSMDATAAQSTGTAASPAATQSPGMSSGAANTSSARTASATQPTPVSKPSTSTRTSTAKPAGTKGGAGRAPTAPTVVTKRDSVGHPQAQPEETWSDWAGHKINAAWHFIENWLGMDTNPVAGKSAGSAKPAASASSTASEQAAKVDLGAVAKKMSDLAEEQTTYAMPSSSTVVNLKQIADGTIQYGTKETKKSRGQCYMYVKVALWKANAIKFVREKNGTFAGAGGSYAKVAGAFLESQGFVNVTSQLPDARWALPGDVIVYHVMGDAETADGKGQPGHIDIRTYHYYVSDFKRNYLCVSGVGPGKTRHFYEPIGIYRKQGFSDPLPLARMKAFLKIIRSREAKTFLELAGDAKTYYASQGVYTLSGALKDLSTYPNGAHHQGAYQMTKAAWLAGQRPEQGALPADFQPATQDRYAVFLMEGHPGRFDKSGQPQPTALGYVRTGEIEKAVALLLNEWACMPGTSQDQGYTMAQLKADFDKYVKEFSN